MFEVQFDCSTKTGYNGEVHFNMSKGFEVINQINMSKTGISIIYPYLREVYFPFDKEKIKSELHPGGTLFAVSDDQYPSVILRGVDRDTGKIQISACFLCNPEFKKKVEEIIKE